MDAKIDQQAFMVVSVPWPNSGIQTVVIERLCVPFGKGDALNVFTNAPAEYLDWVVFDRISSFIAFKGLPHYVS